MSFWAAPCSWTYDEPEWNTWDTSCGERFSFETDTPTQNGFQYCPYCGKRLEQVLPAQDTGTTPVDVDTVSV